jgi:hypothetical protein
MAVVAVVAGCARSDTRTYDPDRSVRSLTQVGWAVTRVATPPETVGGGRQLAYLETIAPDRRRIDLQFREGVGGATEELTARRRRNPGFAGHDHRQRAGDPGGGGGRRGPRARPCRPAEPAQDVEPGVGPGSAGRPNTRSASVVRTTSAVPPWMVRARERRNALRTSRRLSPAVPGIPVSQLS